MQEAEGDPKTAEAKRIRGSLGLGRWKHYDETFIRNEMLY